MDEQQIQKPVTKKAEFVPIDTKDYEPIDQLDDEEMVPFG